MLVPKPRSAYMPLFIVFACYQLKLTFEITVGI